MVFGAAVGALSVGLVGCAPEPVVTPEPTVLTVSDAGKRYLEAVCPLNEAWNTVDLEVDRVRISIERGEAADLAPFKSAVAAVAKLSTSAEASLGDPTVTWPKSAVRPIADVRETLEADVAQALDVSQLTAAEVATYVWIDADVVASTSAAARAALELPDDPAAACELT